MILKIYAIWNGTLCRPMYISTNLLISPLKIDFFGQSPIFIYLNSLFLMLFHFVAYLLFLCWQYKFPFRVGHSSVITQKLHMVVSMGLLITPLSCDNSRECVSWRVRKAYVLLMSTMTAVVLCNHQECLSRWTFGTQRKKLITFHSAFHSNK